MNLWLKKWVFFIKTQLRFVSVVFNGVLGPPRLTHYTRLHPYISLVREAMYKARLKALEGRNVSFKSYSIV